MDIELQLKSVLRRKPAPPDLAERILRNVEGRTAKLRAFPVRRTFPVRWLAAAAAALVLMAAFGWQYEQERQRRIAAEQTVAQLKLALRITARKLVRAERKASQQIVIPVSTGERWQ